MSKQQQKQTTQAPSGPKGPTTAAQTPVAFFAKGHDGRLISAAEISLRAYQRWESAGKPTGDGVQFWLEAEQDLKQGK
jgi:hypothetical protein